MSIITSTHDFHPFIAGKSQAFTGQRLARAGYKSSKKNPAKFASICASVPVVSVSLTSALIPVIQERMEHAQDGIVRELHEAGKTSVTSEQISQDACIRFLLAELEGERLSKNDVAEWFDSSLSEMLQVALAEKLGVSDVVSKEQETQIAANVVNFKEKFTALAGGRTSYSPALATKLLKAIEVSGADDEIAQRFSARLERMKVINADDGVLGL